MVWLRSLFLKRKYLKDHPSTVLYIQMLDQTNQFASILCNWIIYSLKRDKRTQAFSLIGVLDKLIDPKSKLKFKDRNLLRACLQIYTGAYYIKEKKSDQAVEACERAIVLTEKINDFQDLVLALSICGYAYCMNGGHKRALDLHQRALDLLSNKSRFENDKVNVYIAVCLYNTAIECVHMNMRGEAQSYIMQAYNIAQVHLKSLPLVHTKVLWLYKELKDLSPQRPEVLPKIEKQNAMLGSSDSAKLLENTKEQFKISPAKALPPHPLFKMLHSSAQENKNSRPGTSSGPGEKRIGRDLLISNDKKPRPVSANKQDSIDLGKSGIVSNEKPALSLKEKIRIRSKKEKSRTRIEPAKKNDAENNVAIKVRNNAASKIQKKWRLHFPKKIRKIIKIQKWYRGCKSQQKLAKLKKSIIGIQSLIRRKQAYILAGDMKRMDKNVLAIQKLYRGHTDYLKFKRLQNSISIIQAAFRRKDACLSIQEIRDDDNNKNIKVLDIQRCYRGYKSREKKKALKYFILALQSVYRRKEATLIVQKLREDLNKEDEPKFVELQKDFRDYSEDSSEGIIKIQSNWRRFIAQRQISFKLASINKVKAFLHGIIARKMVAKKNHSAVKIQSWYKSLIIQRKLNPHQRFLKKFILKLILGICKELKKDAKEILCIKIGQKESAAIKIQSLWRKCIGKARAAVVKQSQNKVKGFLLGIIARKRMKKQAVAAIKIQSWIKGLLCRKNSHKVQRLKRLH